MASVDPHVSEATAEHDRGEQQPVYASVLRHLGLSAFVSSALVAVIAVSALSSPSAAARVVRLHPEPPVASASAPRPGLISSVKGRLEFDGKPFH